MRRVVLTVTSLTLPFALVSVTLSGPAWAKTKPEKVIVYKQFSGTIAGTVTASGCNGNTGGGSQPTNSSALASGGTITWKNSKTTTIGKPTITGITSPKCKATGDSADSVTATVTADTTGLKTLGTLTSKVCITATGNISSLGPTKIT
jgi:hypothetical protein